MAIEDFNIDIRDLCGPGRYGDDSTPLIGMVPEDPPSHWGKRTSGNRFESEAYLKFFYGKKKPPKEQKRGKA